MDSALFFMDSLLRSKNWLDSNMSCSQSWQSSGCSLTLKATTVLILFLDCFICVVQLKFLTSVKTQMFASNRGTSSNNCLPWGKALPLSPLIAKNPAEMNDSEYELINKRAAFDIS